MKLKTTSFLILFCIFSYALIAQEKSCTYDTSHTVRFTQEEMKTVFSTSFRLEATTDIVPIRVHIFTNQFGQKADSAIVMSSLRSANLEFEQLGINFKLCSKIEYILDDRLYALDNAQEESDMLSRHNDPNTLDIFYVGAINHRSACGYATLGWDWDGFIVMLCNNEKVLIHELGHYFNLMHTHDDLYGKELVNGSNCSVGGDQVCDTPADPNVYGLMDFNCKYVGTAKDANGSAYLPPVDNHMSYSNQDCRVKFTPQQRTKMRHYYDQVGRQLLNCSNKPDFTALFVSASSKLSKLAQNVVSFGLYNNSVNTYTGVLEYKLYLQPLQGNPITIHTGSLNRTFGKFWSDTIDVNITLAAQIADGTYVLKLELDPLKKIEESNEENNITEKQVAVYSSEIPLPDLVSLITGNTNHESGTSFRVNASHTNLGNVASGASSTAIYLSTDSILESSDVMISLYSLGALNAGQTYRYQKDISLPKDLDKVFYAILVADLSSEVAEISEANNYYAFPIRNLIPKDNTPRPDLKVTAHEWPYGVPTSIKVLEKPYLKFTITNSGSSSEAPSSTGIYISKDNKLSEDDRFIYGTYNTYAQFVVPLDVPTGFYYILLKADFNDYIYETDELNNTYSIPMNIVNEAAPDIAMMSYNLPTYIWEFNKNHTFDIGIKNLGNLTSTAWYYTLHLQKEKYFYADPTFRYLIREFYNSAQRINQLLPLATFTHKHTITVTKDKFDEGYYYMAICANNGDNIRDWEVNNCMIVDKPILFVDKLLTGMDEEFSETSSMEISPNPASENVKVYSPKKIETVRLYSSTGIELMQSTSSIINVTGFSLGIYLVKVQFEDGSVQIKKLVVAGK